MAVIIERKYLLLAAVFASLNQCCLALTCEKSLTNTVVTQFSSAEFEGMDDSDVVQWQVNPSSVTFSSSKNITNYDDVVTSQFHSTYAVDSEELTIYNCTVAPQGSMPYSTAGLYTLKDRDENCTTAANLIVIESGPSCTSNAINTTSVNLSCSVTFAESSIQPNNPILTWRNSSGYQIQQKQPIPTAIDSYSKKSTFSIVSSADGAYECQLTFSSSPPTPLAYLNPKAPNFNASCYVPNG